MGRNWISYAVILSFLIVVVAIVSSRQGADTSVRTINKINSQSQAPVLKSKPLAPRDVASQAQITAPISNVPEEKFNPLDSAILKEKKISAQKENDVLGSIQTERRTELNLQLVGGGRWTVFSDLRVTRNPVHQALFSLGPYHVSRKDHESGEGSMSLIFNENQKTLGVLTGRVVVQVKDNYDLNPIVRDYELKLENSSPEIRTVYLHTNSAHHLAKLNESLKTDQRIERFYFEVVRADWVKN